MPRANGVSAEDLYDLADRVAAMIREVADGARGSAVPARAKPPVLDGRRLLTARQVAEYIGCSYITIWRAMKAGQLACIRRSPTARPRFRLRDVDAWLAGQHQR